MRRGATASVLLLLLSCRSAPTRTAFDDVRLVRVVVMNDGVRRYELSDGSAVALDPLEPFTWDGHLDSTDSENSR